MIVSGLARAGTTSLLNDLADHPDMTSPSYANMPLLLAPRTWERFYKPKNTTLKERSHKDGVLVNQASIEAIEEYFFKWASRDSYITKDGLQEHGITAEQYADYRSYQSLIRMDASATYLAKNNNFLLRYSSVRRLDAGMKMIILYRDPLSHAASLMEKHTLFCDTQDSDPFVTEYMTWLGHHEFGNAHLPFQFSNAPVQKGKTSTIDYWLQRWIDYYGHVLTVDLTNCSLIAYEDYCKSPNDVLQHIFSWISLSPQESSKKAFVNQRQIHYSASVDVLEAAQEIYTQLSSKKSTLASQTGTNRNPLSQ